MVVQEASPSTLVDSPDCQNCEFYLSALSEYALAHAEVELVHLKEIVEDGKCRDYRKNPENGCIFETMNRLRSRSGNCEEIE